VAVLVWWERRRALRRVEDSKLRRDARNLAIATAAAAVMQFLELPVAFGLATWVQDEHWGLVQRLPIPWIARTGLAIVLLDYTLYLWHVLTHRVPLLWRFHKVHHIDREMDASTALRFHFGEIALSVAFRAVQVIIIGPDPMTIAAWQIFLFVCILFHHANIRLPVRWERRIARFIMTPRLHGIHHSIAADEVNSNWSSGLTIWDWLHGTLRTDVPQERIVIGVAGYRDDAHQRLVNAMLLPFRESANVLPAPEHSIRQSIDALR